MSVADNMALRDFDQAPLRAGTCPAWPGCATAPGASGRAPGSTSTAIKTRGETAPIASLSGGNVQRAVLARELAGDDPTC